MTNPYAGKTTVVIDAELREESDRDLERRANVPVPPRQWHDLTEDERYAQRSINELARRRNAAARQQAQTDAHQAIQQHRDATATAQMATFEAQARIAFPGTAAEFAAALPELKRQWQIRQTLDAFDTGAAERKRASGMYN